MVYVVFTDSLIILHIMLCLVQVDASTACRMNPLAALGIDRSGLIHESLRVHGGMVYPPGLHTLPTEKAREGASLPLGYDLYKPDVSLDARKATNGYVGLYKSPPPGLQKPALVVPGAGADVLGLDRRVPPTDKASELGLNGSSSFLGRLPWMSSPYHDTTAMYPFLDSSKYAALNMYKASFMSQPSPYLPQHLAYQSLCAGAGGGAPGAERIFYMSPYPPAPISSPLAPQLRIPTATVAPTTLSSLSLHCQDKSLQSMGPRIHHEPSAFGQQLHQPQPQPPSQQLSAQPQAHHPSHSERQPQAHHPSHSERQPQAHHSSHNERQSHSSSSSGGSGGGSSTTNSNNSSSSSSSGGSSNSNGSKSCRTPSSKSASSSSSSSASVSCVSSLTSTSVGSMCHSVDTSPVASVMPAPRQIARTSQPAGHPAPPPPPPLVDSTLDHQKPSLFRSPSSTASSTAPAMSHPFYMSAMSQEHRSPVRSGSLKPKSKDGSLEHRGGQVERKASRSPSRTPSSSSSSSSTATERPAPQAPTKDPADKPLDLSAKILDFEGPPNGYPPPKLEALAKMGYPHPSARYGLPPSRELLKETLSPSSSATVGTSSTKTPERPEIISTLHSSWVVPSSTPTPPALNPDAGLNKGPSVIKNKNLEHVVVPQPRSTSSCPRVGEANHSNNNVLVSTPAPAPVIVTPIGRPSSTSPSPKMNGEWPKSAPTPPEKVSVASRASSHQPQCVKVAKPSKKPDPQDIPFKTQQPHMENGHPSGGHLYMPQSDAYLSPGLAYANRYHPLPYPVPDSMSLSHLQLSGKGPPVYPHPVLLGGTNLYPARLPPKPGLPYGLPPSHGEYLTYHDPQEMVHPLMSPHLAMDPKVGERLDLRSRPTQDKPWHHEESPYKRHGMSESEAVIHKMDREALDKVDALSSKAAQASVSNKHHTPSSVPSGGKEEIIFIDLEDADGVSSQANKYSVITAKKRDPSRPGGGGGSVSGISDGKEPELMQILRGGQQPPAVTGEPPSAPEADGQPEPAASRARAVEPAKCPRPESPGNAQDEESMSEHSPLPDLSEEQTLRCARTSGDRTSDESDNKADRHGSTVHSSSKNNSSSSAATAAIASGGVRHYMGPCPKETPKEEEVAHESHEDEEDTAHASSKTRRSSLTKRIANSSGYVGDRFKCVTTELYADSSKLGREQRALQVSLPRCFGSSCMFDAC